ncbi:MAG: hypothetical protein AB7F19_01375 [Candidatus Babeliales bacterium]
MSFTKVQITKYILIVALLLGVITTVGISYQNAPIPKKDEEELRRMQVLAEYTCAPLAESPEHKEKLIKQFMQLYETRIKESKDEADLREASFDAKLNALTNEELCKEMSYSLSIYYKILGKQIDFVTKPGNLERLSQQELRLLAAEIQLYEMLYLDTLIADQIIGRIERAPQTKEMFKPYEHILTGLKGDCVKLLKRIQAFTL